MTNLDVTVGTAAVVAYFGWEGPFVEAAAPGAERAIATLIVQTMDAHPSLSPKEQATVAAQVMYNDAVARGYSAQVTQDECTDCANGVVAAVTKSRSGAAE